jgi:hypothetical protein
MQEGFVFNLQGGYNLGNFGVRWKKMLGGITNK